jgi:hypothetical protein
MSMKWSSNINNALFRSDYNISNARSMNKLWKHQQDFLALSSNAGVLGAGAS